jgi:hypothetical protein
MSAPIHPQHAPADPAAARAAVQQLADERAARGAHLPPEHVEAAAALLADLWAVAARHGITPDQWGWRSHLPRAALDTIGARERHGRASRTERKGTIA